MQRARNVSINVGQDIETNAQICDPTTPITTDKDLALIAPISVQTLDALCCMVEAIGLACSFDDGLYVNTDEYRATITAYRHVSMNCANEAADTWYPPAHVSVDESDCLLAYGQQSLEWYQGLLQPSVTTSTGRILTDSLGTKSVEIMSRLRETVERRPRNSAISFDWCTEIEQRCLQFFGSDNLRLFVDLYFLSWHVHWPVIHQLSFVPEQASTPLLAVVAAIGAMYSSAPEDRMEAKFWLDCIEEMVFSDGTFEQATEARRPLFERQEMKLRGLQAAHGMCIVQNWDGSQSSGERGYHERFSTVVKVRPSLMRYMWWTLTMAIEMARDLGLSQRHTGGQADGPFESFEWQTWVLQEEINR
jgi:hypothetical protein